MPNSSIEDIINFIANDGSPSEISDTVKNVLFSKASEKIDQMRPEVASLMFNNSAEEVTGDNE